MNKKAITVVFAFFLFFIIHLTDSIAQEGSEGEVLMLEEIIIQVAPELPTVVVTIERQEPEIAPATIQSPLERMIGIDKELVKPDLTELKPALISDSEQMLAMPRIR